MTDAAAAGVAPDDFWDLVPREVLAALNAKAKNDLERTRSMAYMQANIMNTIRGAMGVKGGPIRPERLYNDPERSKSLDEKIAEVKRKVTEHEESEWRAL